MVSKAKRRVLKFAAAAAIAVVLGAAYIFIINGVVCAHGRSRIVEADDLPSDFDADCILVLGAGIRADGTPSDMLADRLKTAAALYFDGDAPCVLLSGDHSRVEYDEVSSMERYIVGLGVPADAIAKDYAGFSTYESVYRAKEIFGVKRMIIVTQEYHLMRALYVADALGVETVGVSADVRKYRGALFRELREVLARNKDFLFAVMKPEPTYLGERITLPVGDTTEK